MAGNINIRKYHIQDLVNTAGIRWMKVFIPRMQQGIPADLRQNNPWKEIRFLRKNFLLILPSFKIVVFGKETVGLI